MSIVTRVSLSSTQPDNCEPAPAGVKVSGSSGVSFTFVGVVASKPGVIVLKAGQSLASAALNTDHDGAVVVPGGNDEIYLSLTLEQDNIRDWTVRVRTDKEGKGTGTTFMGGNGGGD